MAVPSFRKSMHVGFCAVEFDSSKLLKYIHRIRRKGMRRQRADQPSGGKEVAMLDLLFWVFFGLGFLVMLIMIVTIFRSVWESRKDREIWKGMSGNSLLQR